MWNRWTPASSKRERSSTYARISVIGTHNSTRTIRIHTNTLAELYQPDSFINLFQYHDTEWAWACCYQWYEKYSVFRLSGANSATTKVYSKRWLHKISLLSSMLFSVSLFFCSHLPPFCSLLSVLFPCWFCWQIVVLPKLNLWVVMKVQG